MALKDYYELSAMLRIQLPILLSFAVLRCLMGTGAKFWARKIVPATLQNRAQPVWEATTNLLSCMHGALLIAGLFYFILSYNTWSSTQSLVAGPLVCSEYTTPRVQGIASANSLLALMTSSDPVVHGIGLATLKAVADGSVSILFLAVLTWRAAMDDHHRWPLRYYGAVFPLTISYTQYCYTDKKAHDRSGGPTIALSFACLALLWQLTHTSTARMWRLWVRTRRVVWKRVVAFVAPPPTPEHGPVLPPGEDPSKED
jgi:hypothetical protein